MEDQSYALAIDQLAVSYDRTPVLWDISLKVPTGKLVAIVGPNGAGKSTLLKAVLGLIKRLSGKIQFFGKPLETIRTRIAYIPQRQTVDWDFPITVRDLVLMGRYGQIGLFRWPRKADLAAVEECLETVGMGPYLNRQISQLSGGQQQRVFLARALMQEADLYFMDEPLAGIDLATESLIMSLLKELQVKGKTLFVVHHDLNSVENYFNWVIILNMHLIANGSTQSAFNADTLMAAYGKSYALLDEAFKLSQIKTTGMQEM